MARRASTSPPPLRIVLALAVALAAMVGGWLVYGRVSDPYRTMAPLPVADYLENANSLRGNVYKLNATIAKSLEWSATAGRLFSVETDGGRETEMLPVLVPPEFNHVNIERGQRFIFKIEVGEKGILRARDVRKL